MSRPGIILGTAAYMSPEQARGKSVDERNIWSFGCVLFEMLSGKRAFRGDDVTDTIAAVVRGEPLWDALPRDVRSGRSRSSAASVEKSRRSVCEMPATWCWPWTARSRGLRSRRSATPPLRRRVLPGAAVGTWCTAGWQCDHRARHVDRHAPRWGATSPVQGPGTTWAGPVLSVNYARRTYSCFSRPQQPTSSDAGVPASPQTTGDRLRAREANGTL